MGGRRDDDRGLFSFLSRWYGPPVGEVRLHSGPEPLPLRRWYAYSAAWQRPLTHQNSILRVEDLETVDGKTVFYVENQAVWLWAFGDGSDPEVFDRANPGIDPWVSTGEPLSEFLAHVAVFEAVMSDPHVLVATDNSRSEVDRTLADMVPCGFVEWRWPGPKSAVREGDDIVAMAGVNQPADTPVTCDSRWFLFVGARTAGALSLVDAAGIRWDYDSRTG